MIYEWRVYKVTPGKMNALNDRFANITSQLFEKHGIKIIGFWQAIIGASNTLYYMLAYDDMHHREKAWNAFITDPAWIKAKEETVEKAGGPLVLGNTNLLLKPTAYSALQ